MTDRYQSPLCQRYASREMQRIFSDDSKFSTWRRLWLALAQAQRELGLDITQEQLDQLAAHLDDIDYDAARRLEAETRHDVMAHIRAYGLQCPLAAPILHLGATSCYVGDNTDILLQRQALLQIRRLLLNTVARLADFAWAHRGLPCLGYTHFQPAQPTTLGKRATLWLQELLMDLDQLDFVLGQLKFPGCKGTTGTGASFLALFDGDREKVRTLERRIARQMGFEEVYPVGGQTYSRKVDYYTLSVLSGIAQSAAKFSNDIRLLAHEREVEEPMEAGQVGSSAMAYKRNPMRSERIASLARGVMVGALNPALTASAQWLERTLDDSANRRIAIPEAFLATDAILTLMSNVVGGLVVNPLVIRRHLEEELPFLATENILMHCVRQGGDRQQLHERIRIHARQAAAGIKEGQPNTLLERIAADPAFGLTRGEVDGLMRAEDFTGMAREQTEEFLAQVRPLLEENKDLLGADARIEV